MSDPTLDPTEAARDALVRARLGQTLADRWTLDEVLGIGGMAAVYAASHKNGKRAALKLLHAEFAHVDVIRERFVAEGYAANRVEHPGVVAILDDGVDELGSPFLVMEMLRGRTLYAIGMAEGLSWREVLPIALAVLDIVIAAHERGVIHRDIKPENIFITEAGAVRLLDFGIAHIQNSIRSNPTLPGTALGTPAFMPPEQARGRWQDVDAQSDVWALGASLYWLISKQPLRQAETINEELMLAMTTPVASLGAVASDVPASIVAWIDRALAFDKSLRFASATAMREVCVQLLDEFGLQPLAAAQSSSLAPVSIYGSFAGYSPLAGVHSYGKRTEAEAPQDAPSSMEAVTHSLVPPLMQSPLARKITGWALAALAMGSLLLIAFWTEVDSGRGLPATSRVTEKLELVGGGAGMPSASSKPVALDVTHQVSKTDASNEGSANAQATNMLDAASVSEVSGLGAKTNAESAVSKTTISSKDKPQAQRVARRRAVADKTALTDRGAPPVQLKTESSSQERSSLPGANSSLPAPGQPAPGQPAPGQPAPQVAPEKWDPLERRK